MLRDRGDSLGWFFALLAFTVLWMTISLVTLLAAPGPGRVVGAVFTTAGMVLVVITAKRFRVVRSWHPGELILAEWPLTLGCRREVRFRRRRRGRSLGEMFTLEAELQLKEIATYQQGTNTHTVTRVVRRHPVPVYQTGIPSGIAADLRLELPADWVPTISLPNNRVESWVAVEAPGMDGSEFQLDVAPRVGR